MQEEHPIEDEYYPGSMFRTPSDDSYTFEWMARNGGGCRKFLIGLAVVVFSFVAALFFLSFFASILVTVAALLAAIVVTRRFAVTNPDYRVRVVISAEGVRGFEREQNTARRAQNAEWVLRRETDSLEWVGVRIRSRDLGPYDLDYHDDDPDILVEDTQVHSLVLVHASRKDRNIQLLPDEKRRHRPPKFRIIASDLNRILQREEREPESGLSSRESAIMLGTDPRELLDWPCVTGLMTLANLTVSVPISATSDTGPNTFHMISATSRKDWAAGLNAFQKGDFAGAADCFGRCLEDDTLSRESQAAAFHNRGESYFRDFIRESGLHKPGRFASRLDKAVDDLEQAVELAPSSVMALNGLGIALGEKSQYAKGQLDRGITHLSRARELAPSDPAIHNNLGNLYAYRGDSNKALQHYGEAIALDPLYAAAFCNRGLIYRKRSEFDKAISDFSKAIRLGPRLAELLPEKATILEEIVEREETFIIEERARVIEERARVIELEGWLAKIMATDGPLDKDTATQYRYGKLDEEIETDLTELSELYLAQKRFSEAALVFERHAALLRATDDAAEAEKLEARAVAIRAKHAE